MFLIYVQVAKGCFPLIYKGPTSLEMTTWGKANIPAVWSVVHTISSRG